MNVHEVVIAPELQTDSAGDYQYAAILAWDTLADKNANRGQEFLVRGVKRRAHLAEDFKIRYAANGRRVIRRGGGLLPVEYQRADGIWVVRSEIKPADELIGWVRESFARDTAREIQGCIDRYMTRVTQHGFRGDMRGTTLNLQVGADDGDAEEADDNTSFNAGGITVNIWADTLAGSRLNSGFRFTGVTIAQGSTINTATCQLNADAGGLDLACTILFENVDNSASFTTTADVTNRVRTAASVAWTATLVSGWNTSPSVVTPLQAVINRAGFASGNAVMPLFDGNNEATKTAIINAREVNTTLAAKLDIDYTAPAAGGQPFHLRDQRTIPSFSGSNAFAR